MILITCLNAQALNIIPEFTYEYESDSKEYHINNAEVHNFEMGILGSYSNRKLNIQAHMAYHLIHGISNAQSQFTSAQGLHFIRQDPGLRANQKNYYISDLQIQYGDTSSYLYLNKWGKHWGPAVRSLTVSCKIPTFPHFGFKWSLTNQIYIEYFHGQLRSNIADTNYISIFTLGKSPQITRNIVGHRLDWSPYGKWNFSISELVIYANRSLEMAYLMPFIPFFPVQNYLNDTDNILMSADVQYFHHKNLRIYGVFLMDEWSPPYTFESDNHNWFGWQTGLDWKNIYLTGDRLRLEYSWTDHRIYHHRFEVNDYYSWGSPVGFWAGPHAEEIYMDYSFILGNNEVQIRFSNAKRGEYTDSMRVDQYERPSDIPVYQRFGIDNTESCEDCRGTAESKQLINFLIKRQLIKKVDISLQYTFVDWKNAGFNPSRPQSDETLPEITKHSLGISLWYRY